ncbi:hypothetical protein [Sulfurimonas marina]|uniref:Uncharacterized protein n=1 Tax=Sulfurimonas marina TaxID=2590551 RepID=A0A7M1AVA4_9BACT|nr:hypothetical protein [Sulfurimonas marina]QOP41391.1 hypothetical protein FJR03_06390 [Sulfurimonas marina]
MLSSITIKRNNHWLYHCEPARKQEMLTQLISHYADKSILIAVSDKANLSLEEVENITVMTDDEIMDVDAQQFDLIIHADLPTKASHYIKRLSCAKELSIGLLLAEESQLLYQIETMLGRTIPQKYLEGFEPVKTVEEESPKRTERTFKNRSERDQKPRYEKKKFGKPSDHNKRRQRNHHKDGTVRTEEERAEYQSRRAESGRKYKSYQDKKASDEKGDRKPFGDKKKYDKKERSESEYKKRKPFDKKRDFESKKNERNSDNKLAQPKRKPRTFMIKASKKDGEK